MKILVSTVKDKDVEKLGSNSSQTSPIDYDAIGRGIAKIIAVYMVSDTLRKIIIHAISAKIN